MGLSRYKVAAAIAVSNMNRAREFYVRNFPDRFSRHPGE
jgi:hypothetical protein